MSNKDSQRVKSGTSHPLFSSPDADIFIRSSDGVIFNLHRSNLIAHTSAFPIPEGGDPGIADFDEPSNVLAILFQFLYPSPPLPNLGELYFEELEAVGYAAHKYQIAGVMVFSDSCIQNADLIQAPVRTIAGVLKYAITNCMSEAFINKVAFRTIDFSANEMRVILGAEMFIDWIMYREDWLDPSGGRNLILDAGLKTSLREDGRPFTQQLASQVINNISSSPIVSDEPQWKRVY